MGPMGSTITTTTAAASAAATISVVRIATMMFILVGAVVACRTLGLELPKW